jgi:abequosyltransferase
MTLLTIGIPTFKREVELLELIAHLDVELGNLPVELNIEIIVMDNNPTSVINEKNLKEFIDSGRIKFFKNESNIGAVNNVLRIFQKSLGKYLWILGDDDLPTLSCVSTVYKFLESSNPRLIYLPSRWTSNKIARVSMLPKFHNHFTEVAPLRLVKTAHMHITFLSSWIIDAEELRLDSHFRYDMYKDTMFPHLSWILEAVKKESKLYVANLNGIEALGGNTGNYDVLNAFSIDLPGILASSLGANSKIVSFLNKSIFGYYLPAVVKNSRLGILGEFKMRGTPFGRFRDNRFLSIYFHFIINRLAVCGSIESKFLTLLYRGFKFIHLRL